VEGRADYDDFCHKEKGTAEGLPPKEKRKIESKHKTTAITTPGERKGFNKLHNLAKTHLKETQKEPYHRNKVRNTIHHWIG